MLQNIGPVQLLIVLVIVLAIFGTKRLRTLGSDLGSAVKGFRSAMSDADKETTDQISDFSKDADFDLYYRDASDSNFRIYNNQSVPSKSTFIHNTKIVLPSQCELVIDQSTTTVDALHVVTSYLNQTA